MKMTDKMIKTLFYKGKQVYEKKEDIKDAVTDVTRIYPGGIAASSAEHYIGLYGRMMSGEGSTWNSNTALLLYYVDEICKESGTEYGAKAYVAAMKFAVLKSRQELIDGLDVLKEKYHLVTEHISDSDTQITETTKSEDVGNESEAANHVFTRNAEILSGVMQCLWREQSDDVTKGRLTAVEIYRSVRDKSKLRKLTLKEIEDTLHFLSSDFIGAVEFKDDMYSASTDSGTIISAFRQYISILG
jgi:hypothetical protein